MLSGARVVDPKGALREQHEQRGRDQAMERTVTVAEKRVEVYLERYRHLRTAM